MPTWSTTWVIPLISNGDGWNHSSFVSSDTTLYPQYIPQLLVAGTPRIPTVEECDLNGDGEINMLDIVEAASAYGELSAKCDMNGNGIVNMFDLMLLAKAYGQEMS